MSRCDARKLVGARVTAVGFCLTVALAAGADPAAAPRASTAAQPVEVARSRYRQGVEAYAAGRYREAIDHFLEADQLAPSAVLSFNIARAYERIDETAAALRWYRDYLRRDPGVKDRASVDASIASLAAKLAARGVQQVTLASDPAAADLVVDGTPVGKTPWTSELAPGHHTALIRLGGYEDAPAEFDLPADHPIDVGVPLKAAAAAAPPPPVSSAPVLSSAAPPPADHPAAPPSRPFPFTTVGWIGIGAGAAALGGAVVFEVLRRGTESNAEKERTQIGYADRLETMKDQQTVARVLAVTGAVLGAAGVASLWLGRDRKPDAASVGLACLPGACLSSVRGKF